MTEQEAIKKTEAFMAELKQDGWSLEACLHSSPSEIRAVFRVRPLLAHEVPKVVKEKK